MLITTNRQDALDVGNTGRFAVIVEFPVTGVVEVTGTEADEVNVIVPPVDTLDSFFGMFVIPAAVLGNAIQFGL
jgi:nitrous oxide reductase